MSARWVRGLVGGLVVLLLGMTAEGAARATKVGTQLIISNRSVMLIDREFAALKEKMREAIPPGARIYNAQTQPARDWTDTWYTERMFEAAVYLGIEVVGSREEADVIVWCENLGQTPYDGFRLIVEPA